MTNNLILPSYVDRQLEAEYLTIRSCQRELLNTMAEIHGSVNQPLSLRIYKIEVFNPLRNVLQEFIDHNYSKHQPLSLTSLTGKTRDTIVSEIAQHERVERNGKIKITELINQQKALGLNWYKVMLLRLKWLIPVMLGISEGVVFFMQLRGVGTPFLLSAIVSLITGFLISLLLKFTAKFINNASVPRRRSQRYIFVLVMSFIAAGILGISRYSVDASSSELKNEIDLIESSNHFNGLASSIPYILFSFGLFMIALLVQLDKNSREHYHEDFSLHTDIQKQINNVKHAVKESSLQRKELSEQLLKITASAIRQLEYAHALELRAVELANELKDFYESRNLSNRKDGSCPDFFDVSIPWKFRLYFDQSFQPKK